MKISLGCKYNFKHWSKIYFNFCHDSGSKFLVNKSWGCFIYILDIVQILVHSHFDPFNSSSRSVWSVISTRNSNGTWTDKQSSHFSTRNFSVASIFQSHWKLHLSFNTKLEIIILNGHAKIFELFSAWNIDSIVKWEGVCIKRQTITNYKNSLRQTMKKCWLEYIHLQ